MNRFGGNVFFTETEKLLEVCKEGVRYDSVDDFAWDFYKYLRWNNFDGAVIVHNGKHHEIYTTKDMTNFVETCFPELKEVLLKGNNDKEG